MSGTIKINLSNSERYEVNNGFLYFSNEKKLSKVKDNGTIIYTINCIENILQMTIINNKIYVLMGDDLFQDYLKFSIFTTDGNEVDTFTIDESTPYEFDEFVILSNNYVVISSNKAINDYTQINYQYFIYDDDLQMVAQNGNITTQTKFMLIADNEESFFYRASKNNIQKIGSDGNVSWTYNISDDLIINNFKIKFFNDQIFLLIESDNDIDGAQDFFDENEYNYHIISIDKEIGEEINTYEINSTNNQQFLDFIVKNDIIYLFSKDKTFDNFLMTIADINNPDDSFIAIIMPRNSSVLYGGDSVLYDSISYSENSIISIKYDEVNNYAYFYFDKHRFSDKILKFPLTNDSNFYEELNGDNYLKESKKTIYSLTLKIFSKILVGLVVELEEELDAATRIIINKTSFSNDKFLPGFLNNFS